METLLIVDDEPDLEMLVRQKFRRAIRNGELDFLSARNGVEALVLLERRPDVVAALCDINMPQMDGLTLIEQVQERFPLVKSVMISAYGDLSNIRAAMNRGAFDFLTKPLDLRDLEVTVARALCQAQRMRETLASLRANNVLKMFVNEAVLRHLNQCKTEEQTRRAEAIDGTVVFVDVCGFTRISELEAPERVVELLDVYFDAIVGAVAKHHGFVDKFIGDAVMAVFREPGHLRHALDGAIAARAAVAAAGGRLAAVFGTAPAVSIGVHGGSMLSCSVGARSLGRFDFTVIGDVVNTAARLQEAAGPWQIFALDEVRRLAGEDLPYRARGSLDVRGKVHGLDVCEIAPLDL